MFARLSKSSVAMRPVVLLRLAALVVVVFAAFMYCGKFCPPGAAVHITAKRDHSIVTDDSILNIVPPEFNDCGDLFTGTKYVNFQMSEDYVSNLEDFRAVVRQSAVGQHVEGNSGAKFVQTRALHFLAGRPGVRQICETGFNLGHSSYNFLTAGRSTRVQSFDLGEHVYAHNMSQFMRRRFPGRFSISFGDSTETLPAFIRSNPDFRCDLIYVDGGHTFDVALIDLVNLMSVASSDRGNVAVIMDDFPAMRSSFATNRGVGRAWEQVVRAGYVHELMRCLMPRKLFTFFTGGFVVGHVTDKPRVMSAAP